MFRSLIFLLLIFFVTSFVSVPKGLARKHEVVVQQIEGILKFSKHNSFDIEVNYLFEMSPDLQLIFGVVYNKMANILTQTGLTLGMAYNFGGIKHSEKFYLKPQVNIIYSYAEEQRQSGYFISASLGKRFPIFEGEQTLTYSPSLSVSVPLNVGDDSEIKQYYSDVEKNRFGTSFFVSFVNFSYIF